MFRHVDLSHPAIQELFRTSILHRSQHEINTYGNITFASRDDLKDHSIYDVKKNQ
jgi:hypothetical protein